MRSPIEFNVPSMEVFMVPVTILLDEAAAEFYADIAHAVGKTVETVLSDALFKLAGELALQALARAEERQSK